MAAWAVELMEPMRVSERLDDGQLAELAAQLIRLDTQLEATMPGVTYGGFECSQMDMITGYSDRYAREALRVLLQKRLLSAKSLRAKQISLNFPSEAAERWFPDLFAVGTTEN